MESSRSLSFKYDVFLSFRGSDTRMTFTSHLHRSLKGQGVNTFMDDDELERGEEISSALKEAIRDSRILLVVFSKNYAESRWCLQELAQIMDCRKASRGHIVLPVFYDVSPSDVRRQVGSYREAFVKHEERVVSEEGRAAVARWRAALTEAGNLSGWDLTNPAHSVEAKIVGDIVSKVWNELKQTHLDIAKYPVGLHSRLQRINKHLDAGSDGVRFIGVCGMGGIGKTTLAKAVYNDFFHNFEAKTFLANVREQSAQPDGLLHLQEQLLRDLLNLKKIKLGNVHRGVGVIKERLVNRRVLVVLDDLSHPDQLKVLARDRMWFASGSRIVITTRDKDLLKLIKVDYTYMVEELSDEEALQLFNHHAFGDCGPKEEFTNLAKNVISYCKGLPLALEVLGSFLLDRSIAEWKSALEKLHRIPHDDILKQLRISFDALNDDSEKDLFLDIAFFFVNEHKDYATTILNGCSLSAEIGISVLTKRCLLEIDESNRLKMHDLLRDMGREIVRLESPKNPGNRSRLWSRIDILTTLNNHLGTEKIEGVVLDSPSMDAVKVSNEAVSRMSRLRLLKIRNVFIHGQHGVLFSELRWLHWHGFPLDFIPNEFHMENLVALDMRFSKLRVLWKVSKFLGNLKVLNLSDSNFLTRTPDFTTMPNLEKLILERCIQLKNVDDSIGHLKALILLDLWGCINLQNLPNSICRVKSLQILDISDCHQINMLPDDLGNMESLESITATRTSIKQVPLSIAQLKNLTMFSFSVCKYESRSYSSMSALWSWITPAAREHPKGNCQLMTMLSGLTSLKGLSLRGCNLSDDSIPVSIGNLQSLKSLDISENNFCHFPVAFSSLSNLRTLLLSNCQQLKSILELPQKIHHLNASNCISLETLSVPEDHNGSRIILSNCPNLAEFSGLDKWNADHTVMLMEGCKNLHTDPIEFLPKDGQSHQLLGSESDIPEWSDFSGSGSLICFQMPACQGCRVKVITICVVYAYNNMYDDTVHGTHPRVTKPDEISKSNLIHHLVLGSGPKDHMMLARFSPEIFGGGRDYKHVLLELDADWGVHGSIKRFGINFQRERCANCLSSCSGSADTVDESIKQVNLQEISPSEFNSASSTHCVEVSSKRGTDDAETSPSCSQTKRIRHCTAIETSSGVLAITQEAESSAEFGLNSEAMVEMGDSNSF